MEKINNNDKKSNIMKKENDITKSDVVDKLKDENIVDLIKSIQGGKISGTEALFKLTSTIGNIVGIFFPQVGLITNSIVLLKEITGAMLDNPSKKDEKETLLYLMEIAFSKHDLSEIKGGLLGLLDDIRQSMIDLDNKTKAKDFSNKMIISKEDANAQHEMIIPYIKKIYHSYLPVKNDLNKKLESIVDVFIKESTNKDKDDIEKVVNLIKSFL